MHWRLDTLLKGLNKPACNSHPETLRERAIILPIERSE
jgi:hypothetical protein